MSYEGPELTLEQSKELIKGITDVACKVMPNIPRNTFYVFIRDYPSEKIGVNGQFLQDYLAEIQKK